MLRNIPLTMAQSVDVLEWVPQIELVLLVLVVLHLLYKARGEWQVQTGSAGSTTKTVVSDSVDITTDVIKRLGEAAETLNIMDLRFETLPMVDGLEHVRKLAFQMHVAEVNLAALVKMAQLEELTIAGACLTQHNLSLIASLPRLRYLDLRACRTIVQHDNTVEVCSASKTHVDELICLLGQGFLKAEDLYDFQASRQLDTLLLPSHASFEIGKVSSCHPLANTGVS